MGSRHEFSRTDRVRKELIREISKIIREDIQNPALVDQIISVTDIDLSNDLRHAKVFVSVMADTEQQQALMEILTEETPKIRNLVGQRIRLRYTPALVFLMDDSLERGSRVTQLLNKLSRGENI